jgi:GNAT superfamily N-acetyltransferase
MTLEIRAAHTADARRLTEIAHAAKRHWGYDEQLITLWRDDLTVTPDLIADHPVYCAAEGAELLGFYALSGDGDVFELEHMWVDPTHIRRGVGRRLFGHAVATVRSLGGSLLRIGSDPNAEGFYVAVGAHRVGSVPSKPEGRTLPMLELVID